MKEKLKEKLKEIVSKLNKYSVLRIVCIVIAVVAAAIVLTNTVIRPKKEANEEKKKVEALKEEANTSASEASQTQEAASSETGETQEKEGTKVVELSENPYLALYEKNPDMAGWLTVDGTNIDYPIMQTMQDEEYYLYRDFDGNDDNNGCLILDTDSDLNREGTSNLIIHGHDMKSGAMFGNLDLYKSEDYYKEHKTMRLYTKNDMREYEVIAVFLSQVFYKTDQVFKYYNFFGADTQEEFDDFYDNIKNMSLYDTGVTASLGDNFITLSTCAYHVEDGRFVVVAKETDRPEFYGEE